MSNPEETFSDSDAPYDVAVDSTSYSVSTPWGYDRADNSGRVYPLVVNGCWGEGWAFRTDIRQKYPAFYLEYQQCSSDAEGAALAGVVDDAVGQGLRVDTERVYLTGYSKGGSGSYKLVRGFLSEGKLFAAIVRVAGQSETELPDDAVEKTSLWYHLGLEDTAARVQVAREAYAFLKEHAFFADSMESMASDDVTGDPRTTWTLTQNGVEAVKYSEYEGVGHVAGVPYRDPYLFDWLFRQSLACR